MLTAAGYPLVNGVRLNKQGKPIVLRLWARTDSPQSQVTGKLITGWFSQLGLKIQYSVHDDVDAHQRPACNYVGKTYKPDYDMYIWEWEPSGSDPQRRLGYFTTDQIQNQNDACWSDPQYDSLFKQQSTTLGPAAAQADRLADGADRLPVVALHRARLPQAPRGLEHRLVDRLGAHPAARLARSPT